MRSHDDYTAMIQLLVDNELTGEEREELLGHLEGCATCQELLEEAETFSDRVRRARPEVVAPAALRERVLNHLNNPTSEATGRRVDASTWSAQKKAFIPYGWKPLAAAAMLCIAVGGTLSASYLRRESRARRFIRAAIADHQSWGDDTSLDVRSNSPQVVAAWFAQRVSFPFRMPNSGIASDDRAEYTLAGGRLVDFGGERAALLVFQMPHDRISLLVSSDKMANATGGKVTRSDGLNFHAKDLEELHVATWDNKGLTYALVSTTPMAGSRSCSSCHRDLRESALW